MHGILSIIVILSHRILGRLKGASCSASSKAELCSTEGYLQQLTCISQLPLCCVFSTEYTFKVPGIVLFFPHVFQ